VVNVVLLICSHIWNRYPPNGRTHLVETHGLDIWAYLNIIAGFVLAQAWASIESVLLVFDNFCITSLFRGLL